MTDNLSALEPVSLDLEQVEHLLKVFLQCTADKLRTDIEKGSKEEYAEAIVMYRNLEALCTLLEIAGDKVSLQKNTIDNLTRNLFAQESKNPCDGDNHTQGHIKNITQSV